MKSKVPKWMLPEPAVCFPNRSPEEASQIKAEEEAGVEEIKRCKRPCTTLDAEGGVEEFLVLVERIQEMKKHLKKQRMTFSGSSISAGGGINGAVEGAMACMPGSQQAQGSSAAGDMSANYCNKNSSTSLWKPCFQLEDFNKSHSLSAVQTDLSCAAAAATEKKKDKEAGSIQIGNGLSKTSSFLDHGDAPTQCSAVQTDLSCAAAAATEKKKDKEAGSIQIGNGLSKTSSFLDHGDAPTQCSHDVNYKEDVDAPTPPELELQLQLFPV